MLIVNRVRISISSVETISFFILVILIFLKVI